MKKALLLAIALLISPGYTAQQRPVITHVLFVTLDGMRWQELFGGLAPELLTKQEGGVSDPVPSETRFGGATPEERRAKLLPFFWTDVAAKGQVFGDATRRSVARVTNGLRFSYPGYNEMLAGFAD